MKTDGAVEKRVQDTVGQPSGGVEHHEREVRIEGTTKGARGIKESTSGGRNARGRCAEEAGAVAQQAVMLSVGISKRTTNGAGGWERRHVAGEHEDLIAEAADAVGTPSEAADAAAASSGESDYEDAEEGEEDAGDDEAGGPLEDAGAAAAKALP